MSLGIAIALLVASAGVIVAACYELPRPDCGFLCGSGELCPDGYTCAGDHFCHRIGAPDTLVCGTPDSGLPDDASVDAAPDAPDAPM